MESCRWRMDVNLRNKQNAKWWGWTRVDGKWQWKIMLKSPSYSKKQPTLKSAESRVQMVWKIQMSNESKVPKYQWKVPERLNKSSKETKQVPNDRRTIQNTDHTTTKHTSLPLWGLHDMEEVDTIWLIGEMSLGDWTRLTENCWWAPELMVTHHPTSPTNFIDCHWKLMNDREIMMGCQWSLQPPPPFPEILPDVSWQS